MKKSVLSAAICLASIAVFAQAAKIPLTAGRWLFQPGKAEFVNYKGIPAIKIGEYADPVLLKDINFTDGTVEYDVEPQKPAFTSIYFRYKDKNESECFYLRTFAADNPGSPDALQYAPIMKGINLWDLLPYYQAGAVLKMNDWNHIKLVISGKQMVVYVNDMSQPALEIPRLEGETATGKLGFDGLGVYIANVVVRPGEVEGLSPKEGFDPIRTDPRYLRNWQVNRPVSLPGGQELFAGGLSKADSAWESITAERRGVINLTRRFAVVSDRNPWDLERKVVYLRVVLHSKTAQKKLLRLGFSDEVWVFLNKSLVFADKNLYGQGIQKVPEGRLSIENSAFDLPLREGNNDLLVGVAASFYGWGIIARLENMEGVEVVK